MIVFLSFWCFSSFISANILAQSLKKDRFIAQQGQVAWTETVEIKDMDTPIIVEAMVESLRKKGFIQLDSTITNNVLMGNLLHTPALGVAKARFRVDILYESYIVSVTAILLLPQPAIPIEKVILTSQKQFITHFPLPIQTLDQGLMETFSITF